MEPGAKAEHESGQGFSSITDYFVPINLWLAEIYVSEVINYLAIEQRRFSVIETKTWKLSFV